MAGRKGYYREKGKANLIFIAGEIINLRSADFFVESLFYKMI